MGSLDGSAATRELPTVTALVAAYNYGRFVGRTLDSVLAQDYPPELLDILVIDDGSTDSTPELLEDYRSRHPDRITVIRQDNSGNRVAANMAVTIARGEFLAMIDADDMWPPDKTRRQVERLLEDETLGLVYCDTLVVDADDTILHDSYWEWRDITPQRGPGAFAEIMGYPGNIALNSTIMFRAELAKRFFPMPTQGVFQDWWITAHAAALSGIDYIEGLRTGYRQHGANATLGATGLHEVREFCKTTEMRRQLLIHGAATYLNLEQLVTAWQAWEYTGREAAWRAQSVYVPIVTGTEAEREQGKRHVAAADEAMGAQDLLTALRERITALACDPYDTASRQCVEDLTWVVDALGGSPAKDEPLTGARRFVTLAYLDELVDEPELLSTYASVVGDHDDATLAVAAIGLGDDLAVKTIMSTADRAGLSVGELPDVLLLTQGGAAAQTALERRANAALTHRLEEITAPFFRAGGFSRLTALSAA
jgi:hypothetical protein